MTITLKLPPDLEARFVAEAKERGVPVEEVVKAWLYHVPSERNPKQDGIPALTDETMSRERIEHAQLWVARF